ncbi:hypothetical protein MP228_012822 [Amoeboaphelidium protococcarum]|nr:hypothetical protein MP228_012822 [Amoeboaphelidium protococcarum]
MKVATQISLIGAFLASFSFAAESTQTYGSSWGEFSATSNPFQCPGDAYVTRLNATVADRIKNIRVFCSDGTASPCYGSCQANDWKFAQGDAKPNKDTPLMMTMYSEKGFNSMVFQYTNLVETIQSVNSATQLVAADRNSNPEVTWPSVEDQQAIGGTQKIITGFKIKSGLDVNMMQIMYRENKTEQFHGLKMPQPPFKLADGPAIDGTHVYGKGAGGQFADNSNPFICPNNGYVTDVISNIGKRIESLEVKCSDGYMSQCFGSCDPLRALPMADVSPQQDSPQRRIMTAPLGFNKVQFYAGDVLTAIQSVNAVGHYLQSDSTIFDHTANTWPSLDDDRKDAKQKIIVGFRIKAGEAIDSLQVVYKINNTVAAPAPPATNPPSTEVNVPAKAVHNQPVPAPVYKAASASPSTGSDNKANAPAYKSSAPGPAPAYQTPSPTPSQVKPSPAYQSPPAGQPSAPAYNKPSSPHPVPAPAHGPSSTTPCPPTPTPSPAPKPASPQPAPRPAPATPQPAPQPAPSYKTPSTTTPCPPTATPSPAPKPAPAAPQPAPAYKAPSTTTPCPPTATPSPAPKPAPAAPQPAPAQNVPSPAVPCPPTAAPQPAPKPAPAAPQPAPAVPAPHPVPAPSNAPSSNTPCPPTASPQPAPATSAPVPVPAPKPAASPATPGYGQPSAPSQKQDIPYCDEVDTTKYTPVPIKGSEAKAPNATTSSNTTSTKNAAAYKTPSPVAVSELGSSIDTSSSKSLEASSAGTVSASLVMAVVSGALLML